MIDGLIRFNTLVENCVGRLKRIIFVKNIFITSMLWATIIHSETWFGVSGLVVTKSLCLSFEVSWLVIWLLCKFNVYLTQTSL